LNIEQLWSINECRNAADIEKAGEMFKNADYQKDEAFRKKSSAHILNIMRQ